MRRGRDRHRERDGNREMNHVTHFDHVTHFHGPDFDGVGSVGDGSDPGSERFDPSNSGSSSVDRSVTTYPGGSGHSLGDVGNCDSGHRAAPPGLLLL